MSEQSTVKEATKTLLRAVLNSTPKCLPVNRLARDYEEMASHPIPFREMGYNTLEDFIWDIPDVITCWKSYGQTMTKAVPDPSTERITSLVSRQKSRDQKTTHKMKQSRGTRCEPPRQVPQTKSPAYHILRGHIIELMRAYKDGISLSKFPEAFAMRFGQYIKPDNVGFTKMEELLKSMSDIIDVKPLSSGDECIVQLKHAPAAIFQGFCVMCLVIHMVTKTFVPINF